ncbi:hypothetical protein P175DRAFT_034708 [Aspergillus ochraceoroseus IBT 24754]|uniref:Uncharacterized protein n=1 Tax=Aspergillus ochraceoroseus IBT 24754 TaxID=1392256 RepID=A0A2T5M7B5_9EURO|nr:uncharacterized protein P175DRAFT_034708 [Aspergillus ochraceoroseus IBT 24754]PTU24414.1 hypothetical protein P175DRAFT_034708 [Aspergillus ochraceoroseus IBT 24754]
MTLDQYYYVALHDTKSRDDDQVVSRKLNSPNTILVVGQLWLWVIDENQSTGFVDIVFENMAFRENNGTFQRPKSVESMMEFMLGIQTELFIKDLNHIDSKSALDVFREHIRDMANGESGLYTDFVQSLKDEKSSANGNSPATQYHNILQEAELLREIKDIRDELNILIALAVDQETVWKQLFQLEDLDNRQFHACTPSLIKEDLEDMASEAKTVQESLDSLLDLKQKQASIKEAETGRKQAEDTGKQANTIMVFTVVTIIFLPLSFLSSLFALNVSDFPHQGDAVLFQGWWIFPIIFGCSAAVSLPLVWVAFDVNSIIQWHTNLRTRKPWRNWKGGLQRAIRGLKGRAQGTYSPTHQVHSNTSGDVLPK